MKRLLSFVVSLVVGGFLFAWVIERIGWEEIWSVLVEFSGLKGISIFSLTILILAIGAIRWRIILKSQGHDISFFRTLQIYAVRSLHDVPFPKALASNFIDRILEMTVYIAFIFGGVLVFLFHTRVAPPQVVWIALGFTILVVGALAFFYFRSFQRKSILHMFIVRSKFQDMWEMEQEMFQFFHWNNPVLWKGLALSFLKSGVAFARAWLLVALLSKAIGPLTAFSVLAFQYIALIVPIPASLGAHDALQAFAFGAAGLGSSTGAAFAFLIRAIELVAALMGIFLLARIGIMLLRARVIETFNRIVKP